MRLVAKLIFVCVLVSAAVGAKANHVLGGNISYECLGGDTYGITLTIYKDCFGSTAAAVNENIFFVPTTGACLAFSAPAAFQSEVETSPLCPAELMNSSCNGGIIPGTMELTYYVEVYLDPACTWELSWGSGDWNYFINVDTAGLPNAYLQTVIDPAFGCNSSIDITSMQVPYACIGDVVSHTFSIDNPAGYTLNFSLTDVLTPAGLAGVPVMYEVGYTGPEPIPGITIDPLTGQLDFTAPGMFGSYVIGVQIEMYDGTGNLIGTMLESMAVIVRPCDTTPTDFTDPGVLSAHADVNIISGTEVSVCVGDSLCLTVEASNSNIFRTVFVTSDFETQFPGGTFTTLGTNPVEAEMCVEVDETMIGDTWITLDATDDACIDPGMDQLLILVHVSPQLTVSVLDTVICNGASLDILATGAATYEWNMVPPSTDPGFVQGSGTQSINPIEPFEVEIVAVDAETFCNFRDTLTVDVSLWDLSAVVTDETCNQDDGEIDLTIQGGSGNYTYLWDVNAADTEDVTGIDGGDWTVTVDDVDVGCQEQATFMVGTSPAPSGSISGDATICEEDCTDITFSLTGTGPFDVNLVNQTTLATETTGPFNDGDTFQVCPTETTVYELVDLTDSNNPQCTYAMPTTVTVTVRPLVDATFTDPGTLCDGDDVDITVNIDEAGTYLVDYTIDAVAQPQLSISDQATINVTVGEPQTVLEVTNVQYTDAPVCPNLQANSLTIDVDPLPTADLSVVDAVLCDGDDLTLHISLTGTGPWTISWTEDGAAQTDFDVAFNEFDWLISPGPSADTEYCITHVLDQGTNCEQDVSSCVDITVNSLPTGSLTVDGSICAGDDYDLTLGLTGNGPFDVIVEDGANVDIGVPADAINGQTVTVTPAATETFCLTQITDDNGCVTTLSSCAEVTVNPVPVIDVTGSGEICDGDCIDVPMSITDGTATFSIDYTLHAADDDAVLETSVLPGQNDGDVINVCPAEDAYLVINSITDSATPQCVTSTPAGQFDIDVVEYSTVDLAQDSVICEGGQVLLTFCFTNVNPGETLTVDLDNGQTAVIDAATLDANGCFNFEPAPDPAADITYCIIGYTNDGNACTQIGNACVDITVTAVPDATITADASICPGGNVDLTINIPGGVNPDFDVIVQEDDGTTTTDVNYDGISDGFIINVSPTENTSYTITSITDISTTAQCASAPMSVATVSIFDLPQIILPLDTNCADTGDDFTISFEIQGGDPATYVVNPTMGSDAGGLISAGPPYIYTSDNILSGSAELWEVSDGSGCAPETVDIEPFDCPIVTYSGTLDLTAMYICNDGVLTVINNNDEILDGNDVLNFIISDVQTEGLPLGNVFDISTTGVWTIGVDLIIPGDVDFDTEYFVHAVAGSDTDGDGFIDDLADANLSVSEGVSVTFLENPEGTLSGGATLCAGDSTALQIDFTGSGPYDITYTDGLGVLQTIDDVADNPYIFYAQDAGTYTLMTTDNDYCTGTVLGTADIVVNPLPTATIGVDGVICEGQTYDFDIDLTGTAPWDVEITYDDGVAPVTDLQVAAATPFVYQVSADGDYYISMVTDANGCMNDAASATVNLLVNPLPTATFAFGDTSFCALTTIDLEIELTGTPDWTIDYSIDAVPDQWIASASPFEPTIGAPGVYTIDQITDDNGCSQLVGESITVTEIAIPAVDAGPDVIVCSGVDIVVGTAGDPALSYEWTGDIEILDDPLIAQPTVNAEDLMAPDDMYQLTLTASDAQCSASDNLSVTILVQPQANAGEDLTICYGEIVTLSSQGVTCTWEDNGWFVSPADLTSCDPNVQPLADAEFVLLMEATNGCFDQDTMLIFVPDELIADVVFDADICFGICDAEIEVTPSGGWGVDSYGISWVDLAGFNPTGVCAGSYDYTVTDSLGCEIMGTVDITEQPEYFLDDALLIDPTCFGDDSGEIQILSGTGVEYVVEELGDTNISGIFVDVPAGTYNISAIDAFGCVADSLVSLTELSPEILFVADFDTTVACLDEDITFSAVVGGGTDPFACSWFQCYPPVQGCEIGQGESITLTISDTTNVWVICTDDMGCNSDTLQMTAVFDPPIFVDATPNNEEIICQGECVDICANYSGGNGNVDIEWYEFDTFGDILIGTDDCYTMCPMQGAAYILHAMDGCSQAVTDTVFVVVNETPDVIFEVDTLQGCWPVTVEFTNLTDTLLTGTCEWDFGDGNTQPLCGDITYTYLFPGDYLPILTVTSEQGCTGQDSLEVAIMIHDYPDVGFSWEPQPVTTLENEVQFVNLTTNAVSYEWDLGGLATSTFANPVYEFPAIDLSAYDICLEATSQFGCVDTLCQFLVMQSELLIHVPNAFTPDNDGLNDVFLPVVVGIAFEDYVFRIWDRWGNLVFISEIPGEAWIGDFENGSHYTQNDVYVWQIEARDLATDEVKTFYGHVTQVR